MSQTLGMNHSYSNTKLETYLKGKINLIFGSGFSLLGFLRCTALAVHTSKLEFFIIILRTTTSCSNDAEFSHLTLATPSVNTINYQHSHFHCLVPRPFCVYGEKWSGNETRCYRKSDQGVASRLCRMRIDDWPLNSTAVCDSCSDVPRTLKKQAENYGSLLPYHLLLVRMYISEWPDEEWSDSQHQQLSISP